MSEPNESTPVASRQFVWVVLGLSLLIASAYALALPKYADHVSSTTVPVGAVALGRSSLIPVAGWELVTAANTESNEVTLQKGDATVTFRERAIDGQGPVDVVNDMLSTQADFVAVRDIGEFQTPSFDEAAGVAVSSSDFSGIFGAATDQDRTVAAEIIGVAPTGGDPEIDDIRTMISSLRLREAKQ